ncbi:hypothetical protein D1007_20754 [Hordeum vulgare]|nr:hypothetical protein D1007_20754 [Hordeum vulgare]
MVSASDAFSLTNLGSRGKPDEDLGDFFEKLDLHEDEFDDVVVEEEAPDLVDEIPWLALARVQTSKNFSQAAFFKDMRVAWNTAKPVRFRPIGANLFVIQAHCLGDWDRIMSQGPWLFRNMAVVFTPYDGYSEATEVPMVHMPIWLQIHKLLDGHCREDVIGKLLRSCGEILETRIAGKVRTVYAVRYEKLARFCKACGIIGHDHKECGNGVHIEKDLKFGDYLYVDPHMKFRAEWESARADKTVSGSPSAKASVGKGETAIDKELRDTTSSPVKQTLPLVMDMDKSARKRLLVDNDEVEAPSRAKEPLMITDDGSAGSGMILRTTTGEVIFSSYCKLFHCNDVLEEELHAVLEGIKLTIEHSDSTIMLQSDCAAAVKAISDASLDKSAYGHMIQEIKFLLTDRVFVRVKISCDQNRVADCLANYGRCGDSTTCWLGQSPPCANDLVVEDCNSIILK